MLARESGPTASGLGDEFGWDDQIDGHGDVAVEAWSLKSLLPDARFGGELEAGVEHGVSEEGDIGEQGWVEREIGIGGEWLIGRDSPGRA